MHPVPIGKNDQLPMPKGLGDEIPELGGGYG